MTIADPQRAAEAHAIAAAAARLLAGTPQRSSGRLNVVSLAAEAGMQRTKLYDHHRALVDTFLVSAGQRATQGQEDLAIELAAARATITELRATVAAQAARIESLTATAVELSLAAEPPPNVRRLHT